MLEKMYLLSKCLMKISQGWPQWLEKTDHHPPQTPKTILSDVLRWNGNPNRVYLGYSEPKSFYYRAFWQEAQSLKWFLSFNVKLLPWGFFELWLHFGLCLMQNKTALDWVAPKCRLAWLLDNVELGGIWGYEQVGFLPRDSVPTVM